MNTAVPRISVVIPSRGAPPSLARLLNCLSDQTLPAVEYEVIVAAGVPEAEARLHVPADLPYTVRVLHAPGPGAARRRNAGALAARADLLLFLDDDMAPEPALLEAHRRAHAEGSGSRVVIGYLPPLHAIGAEDRRVDWLKAQLRDWWEDVFSTMARPGHRYCYTDVLTGNLSMPQALLEKAGGFDQSFTCREDYELGVRLLHAGAELFFCPEARSWHEDRTDYRKLMQRKKDEGKADVMMARKHPEVRGTLHISRQFSSLLWPSRLLRAVTRISPEAADRLVALLAPGLALCESLRIRSLWRVLLGGMLVHFYWRGVLAEAKGWDEVRRLADAPPSPSIQSIDLACGVPAAMQELDRRELNGVRFVWRGLPLDAIPYQPGAEPVRSRHLLAWLDEGGALSLRRAEALCAALGLSEAGESIDWGATYTLPKKYLPPAMVTEVNLSEGAAALSPLLATARQLVLVRQDDLVHGWLYLEAGPQPRSVGDVLQAMLAQLDHTLLLGTPARAAQHKVTAARL